MLKQVAFAILGVLSVLLGLLSGLNVVYNLEPLSRGVPLDTESKLAIVLFITLTLGSFLAAYWLFKRTAEHLNAQ
jgi:hypothetical protein